MEDQIDLLKAEEKATLEEEKSLHDQNGRSATSTNRSSKHSSNLMVGFALIGLGTIFLLTNFFDFQLENWWALFIFIPAFANFGQASRLRSRNGRWTEASTGPLVGGLVLSTIALIFLLQLDWGTIWPIFLIIFGVGALLKNALEY